MLTHIKQVSLFLGALVALSGLLWQLDRHFDCKVSAAECRVVVAMETYQQRADIRYYQQKASTLREEVQYLREEVRYNPQDTWLKDKLEHYEEELDEAEDGLNELLK